MYLEDLYCLLFPLMSKSLRNQMAMSDFMIKGYLAYVIGNKDKKLPGAKKSLASLRTHAFVQKPS